MRRRQKTSPSPATTIADAGAKVKSRIVAARVKLSVLAEAAGVSPSTVTACLRGDNRRPETRAAIWRAYKQLSGERVTFAGFWGPLLRGEAA